MQWYHIGEHLELPHMVYAPKCYILLNLDRQGSFTWHISLYYISPLINGSKATIEDVVTKYLTGKAKARGQK